MPMPTSAPEVLGLGGTLLGNWAHTFWADEHAFESGLTFVLPPNTPVLFVASTGGPAYDVDWDAGIINRYQAVTSRSYHPGGVNTLFMDRSVRFITNSIPQATWRALRHSQRW